VLAAAERELAEEPVAVVGVHSPQLPGEAAPWVAAEAVRRYGITHPVVTDDQHELRSAFGVRVWPTLVVLDPQGGVVGAAPGEPQLGPLVATLRSVLATHEGALASRPLPLAPEPALPGGLSYPGGLAVGDDPVWVADTGHHQLVRCGPEGHERARIGSGQPGLADGEAGQARLRFPRGLALAGPPGREQLLVADTGNHAVRSVELASGRVFTVAGTGRRGGAAAAGGVARRVDLASPWDVAVGSGGLWVAMAGAHQLWWLGDAEGPAPSGRRGDFGLGLGSAGAVATVVAGSGREACIDGDPATAAFAQPSGVVVAPDGAVYVADSDSSTLRRFSGQRVTTVAGGARSQLGDVDGVGDGAALQHPMGLAAEAGRLCVADTLNHKVKTVDPATGEVATLFGDGQPFHDPRAALEGRPAVPADARGESCLREPEALAWSGPRLLVADSDNHRVLALDPVSGAGAVWLGAGSG
jgi:sugar lactone lactonase YvrE